MKEGTNEIIKKGTARCRHMHTLICNKMEKRTKRKKNDKTKRISFLVFDIIFLRYCFLLYFGEKCMVYE